jgi:hypothetical protein
VIFTIAKATCLYLFKVYGIKIDISEMFNAFFAGVVANRGTSIERGMESFRTKGWVSDADYPFTPETTLAQFFARPPLKIELMAKGIKTVWEFHWEVLPNNLAAIFEQYKRTIVVLTGFAWASYYGEGVYLDYNNTPNHAFLGCEPKDNGNNLISDTYPKNFEYVDQGLLNPEDLIKELDKGFKYGSAHACWLTPFKPTLYTKIIDMFKKAFRTVHGAFFFFKRVEVKDATGKVIESFLGKQKIDSIEGLLGWLVEEFGVLKNNVSDAEAATYRDYKFFGKN